MHSVDSLHAAASVQVGIIFLHKDTMTGLAVTVMKIEPVRLNPWDYLLTSILKIISANSKQKSVV